MIIDEMQVLDVLPLGVTHCKLFCGCLLLSAPAGDTEWRHCHVNAKSKPCRKSEYSVCEVGILVGKWSECEGGPHEAVDSTEDIVQIGRAHV